MTADEYINRIETVFNDSKEIVQALLELAEDYSYSTGEGYWLREAAAHIDGMYDDACKLVQVLKKERA